MLHVKLVGDESSACHLDMKRRLPVLSNRDDEVAHRPAWQAIVVLAALLLLFLVIGLTGSALVWKKIQHQGSHWLVLMSLASCALASMAATLVTRLAVPAMTPQGAAIGAALAPSLVLGVSLAQSASPSVDVLGLSILVLVSATVAWATARFQRGLLDARRPRS